MIGSGYRRWASFIAIGLSLLVEIEIVIPVKFFERIGSIITENAVQGA